MLDEGYASCSSCGGSGGSGCAEAYRVVTPEMSWQQTLDMIHRLPADDPADIFGMDKNAEMVRVCTMSAHLHDVRGAWA